MNSPPRPRASRARLAPWLALVGVVLLGPRVASAQAAQAAVPRSIAELSLGNSGLCVRTTAGAVYCLGGNSFGQIGDGTQTARPTLTPVASLANVTQLSSGSSHPCARLQNGTVRCWGDAAHGQQGPGATEVCHLPRSGREHACRRTPTPVAGLSGVAQIASAVSSVCARLNDGTVRCWGEHYGAYDPDHDARDPIPTPVRGLANAAAVSPTIGFACALLADATVRCWGSNTSGGLGDGTHAGERDDASPIASLSSVQELRCGGGACCARSSDGAVRCWGTQQGDRLGQTPSANCGSPDIESLCVPAPTALPGLPLRAP